MILWDFGLPPCPQLSKTFKIFQKCSFLLEIQIPINVMKKRSAINSKGSDWYCCANYNTVDPDSSLTMVHEDMNFLVKYKIRDESNIIIDTVTSMNKVHDDMNSLVKYMIWGEYNNTIDTENFMNKVHEGMNSLVKYMIRGECNITIDTENFMN